MSLIEHAKREFSTLGYDFTNPLKNKDFDYDGASVMAVMELLEVFSNQEHSGWSSAQVIHLFKELASFKNLSPILDDDWVDVSTLDGKNMFQNKRCSALFKEDGVCSYLDAVVFRDENGGFTET